jgi:hypothetical protein
VRISEKNCFQQYAVIRLQIAKTCLEHFYMKVVSTKGNTEEYTLVERRTDLCGCVFEIQEGIMVCVKRCPKHSRPKKKRPFRAKAECVRP